MLNSVYGRIAELHVARLLGEAAANDTTAEEKFKEKFSGDIEAEAEYRRGLTQQAKRQLDTSKCIALATPETYANLRLSIKILEEAGYSENANFLLGYLDRLETADEKLRNKFLTRAPNSR